MHHPVRSSRKSRCPGCLAPTGRAFSNDASDAPSRTRGSSRRSWCCRRRRDGARRSTRRRPGHRRLCRWRRRGVRPGRRRRRAPSQVRAAAFGDTSPPIRGSASARCAPASPGCHMQAAMVGNPKAKDGFTPTGSDSMYMFCNTPSRSAAHRAGGLAHSDPRSECRLRGIVAEVRAQIRDPALTDSRPTPWAIVPAPWHRGRIVLVGDAAHTTTPHLAAGARIAFEDAIVLAGRAPACG